MGVIRIVIMIMIMIIRQTINSIPIPKNQVKRFSRIIMLVSGV